jgi:5,10-methylenetetrahydromethanopterin reductase
MHAVMEAQDRGVDPSGGAEEAAEAADSPIVRVAGDYRKLYESYEPADARYLSLHRGHLIFVRPDEEPLITGDLIRATSMSGTLAELQERLGHARDAGYQEFVVAITPGHEEMIEEWMEVFEGL